jgi:DNA-binding HxlR family transcriptional regulator
LREAIPDITDRMLSERLQELEQEGIVERTVVPDTPVRVEYALTEKGRALVRAFDALSQWADNWVKLDAPSPAKKASSRHNRPKRGLPKDLSRSRRSIS